MTFHLTDDIVRGWLSGTAINLTAVPICVVWLYGTLLLAERRSGYVTRGATAPAKAKAPIRAGSPLATDRYESRAAVVGGMVSA